MIKPYDEVDTIACYELVFYLVLITLLIDLIQEVFIVTEILFLFLELPFAFLAFLSYKYVVC